MADNIELITDLSGAERQAVEELAHEIDVPLIDVANLYKVERTQLENGATVTAYIPVVAVRRVRLKLTHH